MYITENQSIGESVLFMLSARSTLAEMVEDSSHENADVMVNFLMNEATDYEVMNLLVTGQLPEEKYNHVAEGLLFSVLKEQVLRASSTLTEMVGQQTFNDFLTKVDTLYPHVSTAAPMLEFFAHQDPAIAGAMLLAEGPAGAGAITKAAAKKLAAKTGEGGMGLKDVSGQAKAMTQPGYGASAAGKSAGATDITKATWSPRTGGEGDPTGASSAKSIAQNKAGVSPSPADSPVPGGDVSTLGQLKQGAADTLASIKAGINSAADAVSSFAKTPAGWAVGGAALAALLAYGSAKTYKRFFSKAAGACRGMGGPAKTDCMKKYQGRAYMAQAGDLQRGMASCGKAKNPDSCKSAVSGKIERLKAKARKISG